MEQYQPDYKENKNPVHEDLPVYESREALEDARLREAVGKTDTEKFRMFTRMMRITMMLNRATIVHKQE